MSTVGTISKRATDLATNAVGKAAHAVTHPVETASAVAGQARRAATAVLGGEPEQAPDRAEPAAEAATPSAPPAPPAPEYTTPAGTTAAGPGYNPDTTETDLHQPDTEPLMDPSLTKKVKAESETLRRAADADPER